MFSFLSLDNNETISILFNMNTNMTDTLTILPTTAEILPLTESVDITAGITVTEVKRRGRKPSGFVIQLPDGEFNMKDLVALNSREQGFLFPFLKKARQAGLVKEIRRVKAATVGRPSVVYSKA